MKKALLLGNNSFANMQWNWLICSCFFLLQFNKLLFRL